LAPQAGGAERLPSLFSLWVVAINPATQMTPRVTTTVIPTTGPTMTERGAPNRAATALLELRSLTKAIDELSIKPPEDEYA
jgi:hypothetical protein